MHLKFGDVCFVDGVPDPQGANCKSRRCIVIHPPDRLKPNTDPVLMLGVSATSFDDDAIPLPNLQDNPSTTSGLDLPCKAVPKWVLSVRRSSIKRVVGDLRSAKMNDIAAAVKRRVEAKCRIHIVPTDSLTVKR